MITIVVAIHILVCISLCIVILLQQGKGADIGAVFGGSSQTVFGAGGAGNALTRATALLATVFFATSIVLAYTSAQHIGGSIFGGRSSSVMPRTVPLKVPVVPAPPGGASTPGSH